MGSRLVLDIGVNHSAQAVQVELPGDVAITSILPNLLQVLDLQADLSSVQLRTENGAVVDLHKSLGENDLQSSDLLLLSYADAAPADNRQAEDATTEVQLPPAERARRSDPFKVTEPCLVAETGHIFVLPSPPAVIGRKGATFSPHVDLAELDTQMAVSRKHAEIVTQGVSQLALQAFETTNGMLVNNSLLSPGEAHLLQDGDVLQFGFRKGVKLTFRSP